MLSQIIFNSLTMASIYMLMTIGLTLVFGVMKIPNFAHGALYAVGAFVGYVVIMQLGGGYVLGLIVSVFALFFIGMILERIFFRPVLGGKVAPLIVALGLAFAITNAIMNIWGSWPLRISTPFTSTVALLGATFTLHRLIVIISGMLIALITYLFLMRTKLGTAIRGVSQDSEAAASIGVNIHRIYAITFGIACALAAIAGVLVGPLLSIYPTMGDLLIVKAFAIIILGGMGSVVGAVFGAFVLAFAENFTNVYIAGGYGIVIAFAIMITILIVRPRGLFG